MKKIYIKKSGTMGMGTGSDTRMYAPRSESSHMYRANNEDEYTYTGVEDPKYRDEFADKKKKERKARADEMKNLKHLSITTEDIAENDDDEDEDKFNPREGGREPSLQTGTSGNFGALTSLAMQARGPGFAGGEGVEGYKYSSEPMDIAFQLLKSPVMPGRAGFPEDEQETIDLEHHMLCEDCEGSGIEPDPDFPGEECTTCDGTGTLAGINENIPAYADKQGMRAGGQQYFTKSKKSKKKDRKAKKEERKKWRPSTRMFKKPPGGFDISGATNRRAKARMRGIKGGKRTGLGRAHLSVEMGHRTVGRNKQPTSKDIGRYRQYLGQQEAQRRLGNIRSPTSIPQRFGARSFRAGSTGGGALRQLPGQAALARRPAIRRPTRPRMMPARGVRRPVMPRAPRMPNVPSPQYQSGYANQSMAGGAQYMPSRMPSASVQGGPSMVMTSKVGVGSDLQKRGMSYYDTSELRQLINEARQALKRKESKKKGMGSKDTGGAGSNLPRHNNAPTKETTNPTGATEDANNDPRTFGVNPLDHLTGKGGRTP